MEYKMHCLSMENLSYSCTAGLMGELQPSQLLWRIMGAHPSHHKQFTRHIRKEVRRHPSTQRSQISVR